MKYLLQASITVMLIIPFTGKSQIDSLGFVHAKWNINKIARGIKLKQYWFDHTLFNSNQNISILEIKLNKKNRLDVEAEASILQPTSNFGNRHDAVAAINGTFFDMKNGGSVDYIRIDGHTLNQTRLNKNNQRTFHQKSAIVISGNKVSVQKWDGSEQWEDKLTGEDVMCTGPLLIQHHKMEPMDTISFYTARHPRSALAVKGNIVLLITADGRNLKAAGMSLEELASICKWLNVDDAVNLDGGGSTTLWVNHFANGDVINYPSDNKKMEKSAAFKPGTDLDNLPADTQKWDHTGERPVANVILVNKKK